MELCNLMESKTYSIGEIAQLLNIHIRTLRIYDNAGLLSPKRSDTNRRKYTETDILRLKSILYLTRALGVNINGVKIIFKLLEKNRIRPELTAELLKNVSKSAGITDLEIQNNLKRYHDENLTF